MASSKAQKEARRKAVAAAAAARKSNTPAVPGTLNKASKAKQIRTIEKGETRPEGCLGCAHSVLAGRGDGTCFESAGRSRRCYHCNKGGHECKPLDKNLLPYYKYARELAAADDKAELQSLNRAFKLAERMLVAGHFGETGSVPVDPRARAHELVDSVFDALSASGQ